MTSDNHFGHKNIKRFCPNTRIGDSIEDINRNMIAIWQSQVGPSDIVFMLGDCFFMDAKSAMNVMHQLPGQKYLCWGNHDKVIKNHAPLQKMFVSIEHWREMTIDGKKVIMHHYPTFEWKDMHKGAYHLYGHIHSKYGEIEHPGIRGRAMDVGIDSRPKGDMKLWSWEEVDRILSKREVRSHQHGTYLEQRE